MHRGLGRTSSDTQKNLVRGRDTSTRKFNEKNSFRTSLEVLCISFTNNLDGLYFYAMT